MNKFDIVVIGAGISGATLAECYASRGKKVLVEPRAMREHVQVFHSESAAISKNIYLA